MIIFGIRVRLQNFQVMFVYWGHRTKVTVTGAKKRACVSCSRMVCVRVKGSLVSTHIWIFFFEEFTAKTIRLRVCCPVSRPLTSLSLETVSPCLVEIDFKETWHNVSGHCWKGLQGLHCQAATTVEILVTRSWTAEGIWTKTYTNPKTNWIISKIMEVKGQGHMCTGVCKL